MESINPYRSPSETGGDEPSGSPLVDVAAYRAARLGLRLVYVSIVCGLFSIIGGIGLSILTGAFEIGALAMVSPLLLVLGTMVACALMFAGQILSCRVPSMTGARGHAIASTTMTGGAMVCLAITIGLGMFERTRVAERVDQAFGLQIIVGGVSVLMMAFLAGAVLTYVLYLRALATHFHQPELEHRAQWTLRMMFVAFGLWIALIAFAVAIPFGGGGELIALSALGVVGFLVVILVRVSNLVLQLIRAIQSPAMR